VKLLTKELEKRFKEMGSQENKKDPIVIAKFFTPDSSANWYATEYIPEERMFFGYASIFGDWCDEFGYFSLDELESIRGRLGLPVERELWFSEKPLSQALIHDGRSKSPHVERLNSN
jgi:hypothetical protein